MQTQVQRAPREILEGFRGLATSTIANVLDDLGVDGIITGCRPLGPGFRFVGSAYTVQEVTGARGTYTSEDFRLGAVIDGAQSGDVIVVDNAGHAVSTWGGVASFTAHHKGVAGLLVDGGVRDLDEIVELGFPVFSRHVVPTTARTRIKIVGINVTVKIDGIRVRPGDVMVADGTGVACIPIEHAADVLAKVSEFDRQDKEAREEIRKGMSFTEAFSRFTKL
jgi:regulator of RNase E activity RraA